MKLFLIVLLAINIVTFSKAQCPGVFIHIFGSLTVFDMKTVNTEGAEEQSVTAMFAAVAEWLVFVIINKKTKTKTKQAMSAVVVERLVLVTKQ